MTLIKVKYSQGAALVYVGSLERLCCTKWNRSFINLINYIRVYLQFLANIAAVKKVYCDNLSEVT